MTTPEFAGNRDNFCYRHPDRQSFVLCQRCLRTICPECQTQAPVGVICPECMNAERKNRTPAQKRAERRWSGRAAGTVMASARSGKPVVTYALLAVTSFIGLLQLIPGIGGQITNALLFAAPYLYPNLSIYPFEPWRLVTAMLVHGGFIHLALNMLALWMLGQSLEPMLGRARFLALYLVSGLGGSVMVACLAPNTATVGASGAIFGMMAALLIIGRHIGANVTGLLVILGINFALGFFIGNIAWQAHLGGAIVGALIALIYTRTRRREQRTWQIVLLAALVVLLLVVVAFVPPLIILS
ncbi:MULTISPECIES: rhomboid family intramembrane serine protease [unclassified Microbacterium]|uniref:rhomboid family intramembrane serine protease n=1 Tax=unclassified Microbacterium TaxID=2609290 RepID=UPI000EA8419A|nr:MULTISPECIES: rhomboid family intramembrane serine protease [unclassified Microbacterium]MBT2484084.1 rhomboid family intramembrane serine protease [Microbacterium sp. ISL-108]RKN67033.1 rhomboid family intramembrane serine protease [Microbacterium sp. CGR2]